MKNVSLKTNKLESPKTPGGISKSLLTPCRRVGLSRNWKRSGSSPFVSPKTTAGEASQDKVNISKRKETGDLEGTSEECGELADSVANARDINIEKTPSRITGEPKRKKSKKLLSALKAEEDLSTSPVEEDCMETEKEVSNTVDNNNEVLESLSTPVRLKTKSKSKKSPSTITSKNKISLKCDVQNASEKNMEGINKNISPKENSPKNLVKECIVVIHKKIFKQKSNELEIIKTDTLDKKLDENVQNIEITPQGQCDSDSDDLPLCQINKNEAISHIDEDDDFVENNVRPKIVRENKPTVKEQILVKKHRDSKNKNLKSTKPKPINQHPRSCEQFEDDDFEFENKRTILVRKSYEKVSKPSKAKSTGSITQKDIDDIKARIESKKKLLLAKAMTEDTEELRDLIKKWRIGCQNALMELMELMKNKLPDKQNMEYSEILKSLKIPSSLVGYDSDNDCFNTPDDNNIILSGLNLSSTH